ncbi:MAG: radical SAM protein [Planctomycetes bacterium]|nr:radical SAM protein [Planctomycetota bacterium]
MESIYQKLLVLAERESRPLKAHVELTRRCNERCVHCNVGTYFDENALSLGEWQRVFQQLHDAGAMFLTISGGEATLHPKFREVMRSATSYPMLVSMITNATNIDDDLADFLAEIRINVVFVSVYGATAETHDAVTRLPGSFAKTWRGIRNLVSRGVTVDTNVMALAENVHEIDALLDLARREGTTPRVSASLNPMIRGKHQGSKIRSCADFNQLCDSLDADLVATLRRHENREDALNSRTCSAGISLISILHNGDIQPCSEMPLPVGNVRTDDVAEVWSESGVLKRLRTTTVGSIEKCSPCGAVEYCTRCPGASLLETGDVHTPHEDACETAFTAKSAFERIAAKQ